MKIIFWNMQRLGQDSDKREAAIKNLQATQKFDYLFLCEVTSTHPHGQCNNNNPYTLRYILYNGTLHNELITFADPVATDAWKAAAYKGGTDFDRLAPRGLGYVVLFAATPSEMYLYCMHGPSSNNAVKVASFVACYLNELHEDKPWLLMGDLNVTPDRLASAPVDIDLGELISAPSMPTHKNGKILDYALSNLDDVEIATVRRSLRITGSDHSPIMVTLPD